jgi:hypothetical protein
MDPSTTLALYAFSMIGSAILIGFSVVLAGWLIRQGILLATAREIEALEPAERPQPTQQARIPGGAAQSP